MEVFLIKALQLMLSLSILVLLHEGGHFFFSKLFGVRVEKFYLFFRPLVPSLRVQAKEFGYYLWFGMVAARRIL